MPASEADKFPKHDKMQVSTFKEYTAHLKKLGLEAEKSDRKK